MVCYHPLSGVRGEVNSNGKRPLLFGCDVVDRAACVEKVPCGQCIGCRLDRSMEWACRCMDEASLYSSNCFVTLTFDNEHLPKDLSLRVRDWQLFMKRLRKVGGPGIRFFHCGEYGSQFKRPHYHGCIFNYDFADKVFFKNNKRGDPLFISASLRELWPGGHSLIGAVTFESAAYVARYCVEKVNGPNADYVGVNGLKHYERFDSKSGEIFLVKPEYTTMSRRPGIGRKWYDKFKLDMYPDDFRIMRGMKMKPPRFYDGLYEVESPVEFKSLKMRRYDGARRLSGDSTPGRLAVREVVKLAKINSLERSLEVM